MYYSIRLFILSIQKSTTYSLRGTSIFQVPSFFTKSQPNQYWLLVFFKICGKRGISNYSDPLKTRHYLALWPSPAWHSEPVCWVVESSPLWSFLHHNQLPTLIHWLYCCTDVDDLSQRLLVVESRTCLDCRQWNRRWNIGRSCGWPEGVPKNHKAPHCVARPMWNSSVGSSPRIHQCRAPLWRPAFLQLSWTWRVWTLLSVHPFYL